MLASGADRETTEVAVTSAQNTTGAGASLPQAEVYQAARQDKPWGYELIFAGSGDQYVGKIIHVNEGGSLSLQYHQQKDETISVISGEGLFEYGPSSDELTDRRFGAGDTIHLPAGVVHRVRGTCTCQGTCTCLYACTCQGTCTRGRRGLSPPGLRRSRPWPGPARRS
jgi:mannose-6-phosphate isomerase-like protein (cupin superfamily)